jgi:ABC-2 type transport system permease protein
MRLFWLEWRALTAHAATWLIAALALVLQGVAIFNGATESSARRIAAEDARQQQQAAYDTARREIATVEEQRRAKGIPRSRLRPGIPSPAFVEGRIANFRAAIPPFSTAVLSSGTADALPQRYSYRTGERFSPFTRTTETRILGGLFPERQTANPASLLSGTFDLGFVSVCILPILILTLTYNTVSGDRDSGVLALVLAQPVSFRRLLVARLTVRAAFLMCLTVVLPTVVVLVMMPTDVSGDSLARLGIWIVASAAYFLFWLFLGALVSVRARNAALSSVMAVAAWLVLVVILPAIANLTVSALIPANSVVSFADAERAASLDVNPRIDEAIAAMNRLVRSRPASNQVAAEEDDWSFSKPLDVPEAADLLDNLIAVQPGWQRVIPPAKLSRALAEVRRLLMEQRLSGVVARASEEERRLELLTQGLQFFSPTLLFQGIADTAAGTDHRRWKQFLSQTDEYVRQRDAFFTARIVAAENVRSTDFDHLTVFTFREESGRLMIARLRAPMAGLLGFTALLGVVVLRISRTAKLATS